MKKGDFLIIAAAVLLTAAGFIGSLLQTGQAGGVVTVTSAGEVVGILPLDDDFETTILTADGGENTLVIKDGKADVVSANCYGNDCVHQRAIEKNGEMIVCLPHKLIITVTNAPESENDLVT